MLRCSEISSPKMVVTILVSRLSNFKYLQLLEFYMSDLIPILELVNTNIIILALGIFCYDILRFASDKMFELYVRKKDKVYEFLPVTYTILPGLGLYLIYGISYCLFYLMSGYDVALYIANTSFLLFGIFFFTAAVLFWRKVSS